MYAGGLDIGTSGCKIVLYDEKGNFITSFYKEYNVKRSQGLHEIDAKEIFSCVCEVLKQAAQNNKIASIAVTSFGETFTMMDGNDNPCAPSMLYTDPETAKWFVEETGCDALACAFGAVHGLYTKEPNLDFDRVRKIKSMINVPIVMHGGSGVSDEDYKKVI